MWACYDSQPSGMLPAPVHGWPQLAPAVAAKPSWTSAKLDTGASWWAGRNGNQVAGSELLGMEDVQSPYIKKEEFFSLGQTVVISAHLVFLWEV